MRRRHLAGIVLVTMSAIGGAVTQTAQNDVSLQQPRSEVTFSGRLKAGQEFSAGFEWIDFSVRLSWPKSYDPRTFKPR